MEPKRNDALSGLDIVGYRIRTADTKETEPLLADIWFVASACSN